MICTPRNFVLTNLSTEKIMHLPEVFDYSEQLQTDVMCNLYLAEMSHFPTFFPSPKWVSVWRYAYITTCTCASLLTCLHVHMPLWLCARSPCCQHMVSETVKLQTAAFCGTEGWHLIRNTLGFVV